MPQENSVNRESDARQAAASKTGVLYAVTAYLAWGLFPLYWKMLSHVASAVILAQRIVWSFAFYLLFLLWRERDQAWQQLKDARPYLLRYASCAMFIGLNWGLYVWAVNNGHALESSLGYFINPLVNVGLGVLVLKEKLSRPQKIALALATIGVLILALSSATGVPWIALALAFSFGFYTLVRKLLPTGSFVSSVFETGLLLPLALPFLAYRADSWVSYDPFTLALLVLGGVVTGLPLILFSEATKRLPLSALGFLQYLAPILQLICAVLAFHEPFTTAHAWCFVFIWLAIVFNLIGLKRS